MISCSSKAHFGVECPTCGFQRSFVELVHGDVAESVSLFPATIPLIFTFVFLGFHLWKRYEHGARILLISYCLSAGLIVLNYAIKIADGQVF